MENLELELRKLGLEQKEVDVYLAGLELGPTSVQNLAEQADISRPTTYNVIEKLEQKDLFAQVEEDKTYYVAQSPDHLLGVLRTRKKELEEKEREFVRIIAALKSKYLLEDQGDIKLYKGQKGLKTLQEELSHCSESEFLVLSSEFKSQPAEIRKKIYQKVKQRLGEVEVKEIYPEQQTARQEWLHRKQLDVTDLKGTLILADRAVFLPHHQKSALLVENEVILRVLRVMFSQLWEAA